MLTLESYLIAPTYLKEKRHCVNCGQTYYEAENLGQLYCRLHPGVIVDDGLTERFSCCGIRVGYYLVDRPSQSNVYGCLIADHTNQRLCDDSLAVRQSQVQKLATAIVPQLLYNFGVRPPLNDCILYRLPCHYRREQQTSLVISYPALEQAQRDYERIRQRYEPTALQTTAVAEKLGGTLEVNAILDELEQQSHEQSVFDEMLSVSQRTERTTQEACELIWTDKIITQRRQIGGHDEVRTIDFTLIRRIGTALQI